VTRLLLALALLAPSAPAFATVFIVRHAERADAKDDASLLSRRGKKRAKLLSAVLAGVPLKAVYSTEYKRTQQTGEPTAAAKGLSVTVTDSEKAPELGAELKAKPPTEDVLVVGHTDTIPDILKALGVPGELKIPSEEYDNLFLVTPQKDAPPLFHRLKY
jgi:broad specificity phosphatase PhoE